MTAPSPKPDLPFSLDRPSSPPEAEQFCLAMVNTMEQLLSVIERETELVRSGSLKEAGVLQPEKARLIHEYTRGMMCAKQHAIALGNLAPAAADRLRRQHAEFQPVLRINLAVLATAREVTNDIVSTVAKAVGARRQTSTYGPGGQAPGAASAAEGIAINRSL
ncbi:conserved hypothetical protein [Roseibium sp. TrichSKD4]|uniref:flagellar protein FlgN n=1 Tax=Roseibium sp. TrichSKD4 TaxID=744980 RepID=UPI0001E57431|nr:flagellar protein FlgN [Roseibium sp. TrichSKD4]EFO30771.1 conserved hypothetical protein [Roseibium sp. TrichSKD4]